MSTAVRPYDAEGKTFTIAECSACGALHQDVVITRYQKDRTPYTHWYVCPRFDEPVNLSMVYFDEEGLGGEVPANICQSVAKAIQSKRYGVMIYWQSADDGVTHLDRHHHGLDLSTEWLQMTLNMIAKQFMELSDQLPTPPQSITPPDIVDMKAVDAIIENIEAT